MTWSLIAAAALTGAVVGVWAGLDAVLPLADAPNVRGLVADPSTAPDGLLGLLYALAAPSGFLMGWADDRGVLRAGLSALGLELARGDDVWQQVLTGEVWCYVYTTDNAVLHGYIQLRTRSNRDGNGELFLTNATIESDQGWVDIPDVNGVWLSASSISRIEITP